MAAVAIINHTEEEINSGSQDSREIVSALRLKQLFEGELGERLLRKLENCTPEHLFELIALGEQAQENDNNRQFADFFVFLRRDRDHAEELAQICKNRRPKDVIAAIKVRDSMKKSQKKYQEKNYDRLKARTVEYMRKYRAKKAQQS